MNYWSSDIFEQKQDSNGNYVKMSNICDPEFENLNYQNCTRIEDIGRCDPGLGANYFLSVAEDTRNGKEINLNCPQCGCITTPISLYDL